MSLTILQHLFHPLFYTLLWKFPTLTRTERTWCRNGQLPQKPSVRPFSAWSCQEQYESWKFLSLILIVGKRVPVSFSYATKRLKHLAFQCWGCHSISEVPCSPHCPGLTLGRQSWRPRFHAGIEGQRRESSPGKDM